METLLEKSKINLSSLQRVLLKILSTDVNNLSQPCYNPPHKVTYHALLNITGLKDKDIKEFAKRTYKGTQVEKALLVHEPGTNLLLFIMWYALKKRKTTLFYSALVYHMIRQYSHLFKKHFKQYCNEEVFSYALQSLNKTHLFSREKTIGNSLFHLSKELQRRYQKDIENFDIPKIIRFIYESRHRISQSVKTFAQQYYKSWEEGTSIKTYQDTGYDDEGNQYQTQQLERGKKIIDSAVKKLTIYRSIDKVAMKEAIRVTKVKFSIADIITKQLNDIRYADDIRLILQLFIKEITDKSMLCGKKFESHVKQLMSLKRTKSRIYFKQQINILLFKLLKDAHFTKTFQSYTPQSQFIIHSYLAFYLATVLRNSTC